MPELRCDGERLIPLLSTLPLLVGAGLRSVWPADQKRLRLLPLLRYHYGDDGVVRHSSGHEPRINIGGNRISTLPTESLDLR
jgi:hypothetical protein